MLRYMAAIMRRVLVKHATASHQGQAVDAHNGGCLNRTPHDSVVGQKRGQSIFFGTVLLCRTSIGRHLVLALIPRWLPRQQGGV